MGLAQYKPQGVGVVKQTAIGTDTAQSEMSGTKSLLSLADTLKQFSNIGMKLAGDEAVADASTQAAQDALDGKEFHEESIYTTYGKAYNNAASVTYMNQSNIDIDEKNNALKLKFSNDPAGYANAMNSYTSQISESAPTPELSQAIKLNGNKTSQASYAGLQLKKDTDIKAEQRLIFEESNGLTNSKYINAITNGDTATAELLLESQQKSTETLVNSGVITRAEAEKVEQDNYFQQEKGIAINAFDELLETDLQSAQIVLDEYKEKAHKDLSPQEQDNILAQLQSQYNKEIQARKGAGANRKVQSSIIIADAIKVYKAGDTPNNIEEIKSALPFATPKEQHELVVQSKAQNVISKWSTLSLEEQITEFSKLQGDVSRTESIVKNKMDPVIEAQATAILSDALEVIKAGKIPTDLEEMTLALNNVSDDKQEAFAKEYDALITSDKITDKKSLAQLEDVVNKFEAKVKSTAEEVIVMDTVAKNLKATQVMAKNDPMTLSFQQGVNVQVGTLDVLTGLTEKGDILQLREEFAITNKSNYGPQAGNLFTKSEADAWGAYLGNADTPIEKKLEFIANIESSIPNSSNTVYKQLSKTAPIFSMAGSIMKRSGMVNATKLLKGQQTLKQIGGDKEGIESLKYRLYKTLGNATYNLPAENKEAIVGSAVALYVGEMEAQGRLDKGLTSSDVDGERAIINIIVNGVAEYEGGNFFLPPNGASEDDVIEWYEGSNGWFGDVKAGNRYYEKDSQLVSVDLSGGYAIRGANGNLLRDENDNTIIIKYNGD